MSKFINPDTSFLRTLDLDKHSYYKEFTEKTKINRMIFRDISINDDLSRWLLKFTIEHDENCYSCDVYCGQKQFIDCLENFLENAIKGENNCSYTVLKQAGDETLSVTFKKNGMSHCHVILHKHKLNLNITV